MGFSWSDVVVIILVTMVTRWVYRNLIKPFLSPLRKIPGKPYRPLIGNMFEATRAEAMSNAIRWIRELKSLTIRYYHFGGQERLLTADPKLFRHMLVTNVNNYVRVVPGQAATLFNKALFFLSGDFHHTVRKLMNPAFNIKVLEGMLPVFESKARAVAASWHDNLSHVETEQLQIPVQEYMTRITLDSICATGLDYHPDAVSDPETAGVKIITKYLTAFGSGTLLNSIFPFYNKMPSQRNKERWKGEEYISSIVNKTIAHKREQFQNSPIKPDDPSPKDLLSLLLLAKDENGEPIPEDVIFDNVTGFMFAGFDTTSITLTWIMLQLALYPDIQRRVREEIRDVIPHTDTPITHELMDRLLYTSCVIKETQRLYPVVSSTTRRALHDDDVNGLHIPEGTLIVLHVGALHRSEENWTDPDKFIPDRFLSDIEPYKHMPFITGPYMCIGQKFALFEMKIVLVCLLRDFEFEVVPGYKFRRIQALSVKPHPPLVLNVKKITTDK